MLNPDAISTAKSPLKGRAISQQILTCSKTTIEALEKSVKYVYV